jgi:DNA-binding MarR family transcriptional regulator
MIDSINQRSSQPSKHTAVRQAKRSVVRPATYSAVRQAELCESIELLFFGYRAFTARPDLILARRGLGRVHHRILYFVGREPGMSVNRLLATLAVSKQALNAPLRRLLESKLVSAQSAAHDRRIKELRLTAEGTRLEQQLTGTQMKQLSEVFAAAGGEAEIAWREVMRVLAVLGRE